MLTGSAGSKQKSDYLHVIDKSLVQSPPKFYLFIFGEGFPFPDVFSGLFPTWICEINPMDFRNIPFEMSV